MIPITSNLNLAWEMNSVRHHPSCSEDVSVLLIDVNNLSYLIINSTFFFITEKNLVIGFDTNCICS